MSEPVDANAAADRGVYYIAITIISINHVRL